MELNAPEVDDPRESGSVVHDDFLRRATGRERKRHGSQPTRTTGRSPLLVERFTLGAVDEALEHDGPIPNACDGAVRDRQVILDDVALRQLDAAGEVRLVRVRDADLAAADRKHFARLFALHRAGRGWDGAGTGNGEPGTEVLSMRRARPASPP